MTGVIKYGHKLSILNKINVRAMRMYIILPVQVVCRFIQPISLEMLYIEQR